MQIKAELHAHTSISPCSTLDPANLIRVAKKNGIDVLFITDHDAIGVAQKLCLSGEMRIVVGEEVSTSNGDLLGFFLKEKIPSGLTANETAKRIKDQGGVVAVPHPCDIFRKKRFNPEKLEEFLASGFCDCVEAWNARNIFSGADKKAEKLSLKHGLPFFSGSDAHTPAEVGRSATLMPDFSDGESFKKSLKNAELIKRKSPIWVHGITKIRKTLIGFGGESTKL